MGVKVSHWDSESKKSHTTVEHLGFVVDIGSQYMGDGDSHFWAVVFNPETGEFENKGLGYTPYDATVDADPDLQAAYDGLVAAERALVRAKSAVESVRSAFSAEEREDHTVRKGKWVKVVKGRKVPKGTVGLVKVHYEGQWGWSVLLETLAGEEVWTAESNVEVLVESTVEAAPVALEVAA